MKAGALDYILKPFTLRTLLPVLERALTVRHLHLENDQLRQAESAVRRLNASLERRVEERTRQLTDANRELEAFSHSVSHDLRAPLRSITGFGAMLIEQCGLQLDERARGYIDRMLTAATRMGSLIEDLMRLSQITGADLRRMEVDLSAMAHAIVDELRAREPDRQITTSICEHLRVNADPQLLRIAMENLLGNAWKFTRKVAGAHIELGQRDDDRGTYFVRDNGAGFDMQRADDLFAPFRRLHSSSEFPGTGVGLSIVQRIIRRHGGSIDAHSVIDEGATFFFSIPGPTELHS
jgi:light-regulated signal transduction histidine kinase (bacteriophytochrome)